MNKIIISQTVRQKLPHLVLGCISCNVLISEENHELWQEIETACKFIERTTELDKVGSHPAIRASRIAYRSCGKDPARYRLSSEALMRRAVKGNPLYRINNVVDLVNLVSLKSGMSIGGYDADKIVGEVIFDIGMKEEPYEAIGRGELNIEYFPVFRDSVSAFGSPTSDSVRTSVTGETRKFLMVIVGFSGDRQTQETVEMAVNLLGKYADADQIEVVYV